MDKTQFTMIATERRYFMHAYIALVDHYGGSRTFWAMEGEGGSATTSWKRFAVNLTEYTSQTLDFRISSVDYIACLFTHRVRRAYLFGLTT